MDYSYLNFNWIIEGALAGAIGATARNDLYYFKMQEIRSVVRLDENCISAEPWQLTELYEPVTTAEDLRVEQIHRITIFIEEQVEKWEKPVVVTCGTGLERTGVILACYLILVGHQAQSAINLIQDFRNGSLDTDSQKHIVFNYEKMLRSI